MTNAFTQLDRLAEQVDRLEVDCNAVVGQEIDQSLVKWYSERFSMLVEDGVSEAISSYLKKLMRENTNEITRVVIMHDALSIQLGEGR